MLTAKETSECQELLAKYSPCYRFLKRHESPGNNNGRDTGSFSFDVSSSLIVWCEVDTMRTKTRNSLCNKYGSCAWKVVQENLLHLVTLNQKVPSLLATRRHYCSWSSFSKTKPKIQQPYLYTEFPTETISSYQSLLLSFDETIIIKVR